MGLIKLGLLVGGGYAIAKTISNKREERRQNTQRGPQGTNNGQYRDNYDDKYEKTYDHSRLPESRQIEFPEDERSEFETHEEFAERQRLRAQARGAFSGSNGYDDEKRRYQQQVQQHQQDRSYNYIGAQQGPSSWQQQPPSYQQPPQTFYPGQDYPGKN